MRAAALCMAALAAVGCGGNGGEHAVTLTLYCAAGVKPPVEQAAAQYADEYGVKIYLQYGGSGTLLSNLQISQKGDLYLAADESYLELAAQKNLAAEAIRLARLSPVIAVPEGNPKGVQSLDDLERSDLRVALANPEAAAIGRLMRDGLKESGRWERLQKAATTMFPTVTEIANALRIGSADAGVIWDATANQYPQLETVADPELEPLKNRISIGVLSFSERPTEALRFARYLSARGKGLPHFTQHGYAAVEGDVWAEEPHLRMYCEPALRRMMEEGVRAFELREGTSVLFEEAEDGAPPDLDAYISRDAAHLRTGEARPLAADEEAQIQCAVNEQADYPRLTERMIQSLRAALESRGYDWRFEQNG